MLNLTRLSMEAMALLRQELVRSTTYVGCRYCGHTRSPQANCPGCGAPLPSTRALTLPFPRVTKGNVNVWWTVSVLHAPDLLEGEKPKLAAGMHALAMEVAKLKGIMEVPSPIGPMQTWMRVDDPQTGVSMRCRPELPGIEQEFEGPVIYEFSVVGAR
jgi:hypothetical protein